MLGQGYRPNVRSLWILIRIAQLPQGRLCGAYRSYYDNNEGLLLAHTTLRASYMNTWFKVTGKSLEPIFNH